MAGVGSKRKREDNSGASPAFRVSGELPKRHDRSPSPSRSVAGDDVYQRICERVHVVSSALEVPLSKIHDTLPHLKSHGDFAAFSGRMLPIGGLPAAAFTPAKIAGMIDHTLLKADSPPSAYEALCAEAFTHHFATVCVPPIFLPVCRSKFAALGAAATPPDTSDRPGGVRLCTVVGFPHGNATSAGKAADAREAIARGADEVDMVLPVALLRVGDAAGLRAVHADIAEVVRACGAVPVKVILETCYLDEPAIIDGCLLSALAGAAFVKTSTGFGTGGATVPHCRIMRSVVGERLGVKASGGVKDRAAAVDLLCHAAVSRIGTSGGVAIVSADPPAASGKADAY